MNNNLIERMAYFAATTNNDQLSVAVSRVVGKLQHVGQQFESRYTQLTIADHTLIAAFNQNIAV